jgi:alanine dehydrogenase
MHIGLPKEIKDGEYRVALTPEAVGALARAGHAVTVQPGAGAGAGFADAEYAAAGAQLGDPWAAALIVKVKELQPAEYGRARAGRPISASIISGPIRAAEALARARPTPPSRPWEADRSLPILAPMSSPGGRGRQAPGSCSSPTAAPACCPA